jgi:hypothetical protein
MLATRNAYPETVDPASLLRRHFVEAPAAVFNPVRDARIPASPLHAALY